MSLDSKEWRLSNLYRIIDKDGNSIHFRMNGVQQQVCADPHKRKIILKARQLGMCLDPNTKVLKADFSWAKICDIKPGDFVVSVDEDPSSQGSSRKMRRSEVEAVVYRKEDCYKITFDNGKYLICTGKHRWLTRHSMTDYHWRSIEGEGKKRLRVGFRIRRLVPDIWGVGDYEDGWMSGMLDGEGSLAKKERLGGSISISQVEGPVFDRVESYFKDRGYGYRIERDGATRRTKFGRRPVNKIVLSRTDEIIKLIGICRPTRFLKRDWWEGKKIPCIQSGNYSTVVKIEFIGNQDVIDLQTKHKTFIADGYVSHNSTYAILDTLDEALFNRHTACGIVSYSLEHAQHIFKRIIGHALETFPKELKPLLGIQTQSAREITFSNGSFLRVDTSLRGGSYQSVLVSEFGKVCARSPAKAEEVVTGTLQAVPKGGRVIIESTAEGSDGYFADMVRSAVLRGNDDLSDLDYKLFFYPWMSDKEYSIQSGFTITTDQTDYFDKLEDDLDIEISIGQRRWYAKQQSILGDKIRQEFPSTVQEAFLSSSDAYYYAKYVEQAYDGRVLDTQPHDPLLHVHVAMDIGVNDATCLIFFQIAHGEVRVIDFYEDNSKGCDFYARHVREKPYFMRTVFLPHDAARRDGIVVENSYQKEFSRLLPDLQIRVLPRTDVDIGIAHAKSIFGRCVFYRQRCKALLDHLCKYRKKWSEQHGKYLDEPYHDVHSNAADAFRYMAQAVSSLEVSSNQGAALEAHKRVVENRRRMI